MGHAITDHVSPQCFHDHCWTIATRFGQLPLLQSINAPSVRAGEEILRIAPSAVHTLDAVRNFVESLDKVWSTVDIPRDTKIPTAATR